MSTSADLMTTLAWSLLHFFWQGAAIAALAAVAMALFRESTTRYLIGIVALALMCVSFGVTLALLTGAPAVGTETAAAASEMSSDFAPAALPPSTVTLLYRPAAPGADFAWLARGWLGIVCLLALRVACGLLLLEHLRRRSLSALPVEIVERCVALQRRLGISRVVRYCKCRLVTVPSVVGLLRPVVLLPVRALTGLSAEQLEAVIAHELGHVKRFDVAVNFLQVVVETLFFFHPAVWWLNKRIRADREDCCDDVAIAACGRKVDYARALAIMEDWRGTPDLAMAATGGDVASRVARLLGMSRQKAGVRSAGVLTAALVLAAALMAGAASIGIAGQIVAQVERLEQVAQLEPLAELAQLEPLAQAGPENPRRRDRARAPAGTPPGPSYIDEMKSLGVDVTDVDLLIALKIHQVTADDVRRIRDAGFELDADEVIAMKIHGVTPEYVAEVRAAGFDVDVDDVMAMKIHGVTPEYVAEVRAAGFDVDVDDVMAMKIHDVTPEYIEEVRAKGFDVDFDDVIAMKIHGITPEFIDEARSRGFEDLSVDQLIQLKNADVL